MKKLLIPLIIAIVGSFVLLGGAKPARADGPNLVPNPSVETVAGSTPSSWQTGTWGTNTSTFTYLTTGHTGSRSVKVQTTSYTNGDAKWYYSPVTVTPNTTYTVSDWYQSNVQTRIFVQFTATDNTVSYAELSPVAASASWAQASRTVTTPASVKSMTVFHLLDRVGTLTIDDASLATTTTTPPPAGSIVNPSVETPSAADPNLPDTWTSNAWGDNTATFSYLTTGHTGSRSVKAQLSNYASGDAKWYFAPVTVTPGAYYAFSDWYQSTVSTDLIAQFTRANGTVYYQNLTSVAASATWKQAVVPISIPSDATKLSVFHVIAANGSLTIDDADLSLASNPPTGGNPVPNPSLEASVAGSPVAWSGSKWGTNTADFQYMNEGHTGIHSAKVTVSNYTDGDAKWVFQPQSLERGKQYRFTGWYKTNTQPHVVAQMNHDNGTTTYFGMPLPLPGADAATAWQKYSDTFSVPSDVSSVSVFMFIQNNGWVQVDDYSIEPYAPTGFTRPLVSLTFDDGHEDNVDSALPTLQAKGFKSTQCYATEFIEGVNGGPQDVQEFANAGHEICSHTVTHPFLTQVSPSQLTYELTHAQQYLKQISGQPVQNFASPYGDYNATVLNEVKKLYRSHRSVDEGFNSKDNFDIYRVRVQNMTLTTPLAQVQSWLDQAKATNTWLVLVYHRIVPTGQTDGEQFDTNQADFEQQMNALQASGLTVKTYNDALNELVPQL